MNRKETEKAIAVMQAYVDGKQIEATGQEGCDSPLWDWSKYSYQVKLEPNRLPVMDMSMGNAKPKIVITGWSKHMNTGTDKNPIMKFFEYKHLPENLQAISATICLLADEMDKQMPPSAEKSAGMRKLLEAKDCFVRAALSE